MRRLQPKPKVRRKVPVPGELREALGGVLTLIRLARRDPDYDLGYDDAIQVDGVICGGRVGDRDRPYVLNSYPTGDEARGQWSLRLHPVEIRDIGDGHLTEVPLYCCTAPDCRCKFHGADETCFFCDYVDDRGAGG